MAVFLLLRLEFSNILKEIVSVLCVSDYGDGREKVKGENSHYRFSIYIVSALCKVNLVLNLDYDVNEFSDVLNGFKDYIHLFHIKTPLFGRIFLFYLIIAKLFPFVNY